MSETENTQGNTNQTEEIVIDDSTPQSETPATQAPQTKTARFIERLKQYSTREIAKTHINEIAKELKCKKSLGYEAIKRITFPDEENTPPVAEVPTVRIPQVPKEEFETPATEQTATTATETPTTQGVEIVETPTQATETPQAPAQGLPETPVVLKLEPILERSIGRLMNEILEIATGNKELLSTQESKDTAILLPLIIYRVAKVKVSEDQFIDMTCVTHFGSIVIRAINSKLKERRLKQQQEKTVPPQPKPQPQLTPPPAISQPPTPPTPQPTSATTEEELKKEKMNQKPPFLAVLGS